MSYKRIVNSAFWTDSKVIDFSPEDKYFMLYLLTNPHCTLLGIYEINPKQCAFELGYSVDSVKVLFDRFENKYDVIRKSGNEIAIKNFLRHSVITGGKPVKDCLEKEIRAVKDKRLLGYIIKNIIDKEDVNVSVKEVLEKYRDLADDLPLQKTPKVELVEQKTKSKPKEEKKKQYAEAVSMTEQQYSELLKLLKTDEEVQRWITRLSDYKMSTGKKYKSDYHTIRSWLNKDKPSYQHKSIAEKNKEVFQEVYDSADDVDRTLPNWRDLL